MKKILVALASVALFAGCSADGEITDTITVRNITGSKDPSQVHFSQLDSYDDLTPSSSGGNSLPLVNCQVGSNCYSQTYTQAQCNQLGGSVVSGSCTSNSELVNCLYQGTCFSQINRADCSYVSGSIGCTTTSVSMYCHYGSDCDLIGGHYTKTQAQCTSTSGNGRGGQVINRQQCISLGAEIFDDIYE